MNTETSARPRSWRKRFSAALTPLALGPLALGLTTLLAAPLYAQTLEDGVLMQKRVLCAGVVYARDGWKNYWEGSLRRDNGNIGTLTTESATAVGAYGVTDRLNVMAMLPYVRTRASEGPLHGMDGFQDLTVAAKYRFLSAPVGGLGRARAFVVAAASAPVSSYTPDFLPLSIGTGSRRATGRVTADFEADAGWFVGASGAYTRRGNVKLDRPAYYTDDRMYFTNEVAMPDVAEYAVSAGVRRGRLHVPVSVSGQRTLGGGDIRRQDMPFISNRMDFVRLDVLATYALPAPVSALSVRGGVSHVVRGRNVGQATMVTGGLLVGLGF